MRPAPTRAGTALTKALPFKPCKSETREGKNTPTPWCDLLRRCRASTADGQGGGWRVVIHRIRNQIRCTLTADPLSRQVERRAVAGTLKTIAAYVDRRALVRTNS